VWGSVHGGGHRRRAVQCAGMEEPDRTLKGYEGIDSAGHLEASEYGASNWPSLGPRSSMTRIFVGSSYPLDLWHQSGRERRVRTKASAQFVKDAPRTCGGV